MVVRHWLKSESDATQIYDLENDFNGLMYVRCDGMFAKGERKDVYFEDFSESDTLNAWQGDNDDVARKATNLTLSLLFTGTERKVEYERFYNIIKKGKWYYWNTVKKKLAFVMLKDEFRPSEEMYKGSTPYFRVDVPLQNLWGECKDCDENGDVIL